LDKKDPQQIENDLEVAAIKLCCGLGPYRVDKD